MGRLALLLLGLLLSPGAHAATLTVPDLLAKNAAARGGAKKMAAIKTLRVTGELIAPGGAMRMDYVQLQMRPAALRTEVSLEGLTQISVWDGKEGWMIDPFGGRKDPQRMAVEDAKGMIEAAAIDGALLTASALGYPIAYEGTEDIDGTAAYKLQVSRPGGDVQTIFLDPDAFLEIRMVSRRTEHGATVEVQSDYSDYESVAGVFFPFLIETGAKDATTNRMRFQVDHMQPNVPIDPALYRFPATGSKP